jgi:hypothetical protein
MFKYRFLKLVICLVVILTLLSAITLSIGAAHRGPASHFVACSGMNVPPCNAPVA